MMRRYLRSILIWTASTLLFLAWVPVMAVIRLFDRDPLVRPTGRCLRTFGRLLIGIHRPQLRIFGMENIQPGVTYLMVANHQSVIDIPLVSFLPMDTKCMARADLFRLPWAGWMLRMSKEISVDRKDPRNAARALLQCARVLRGGCSVLIFAEGTRSANGELLAFAEGPFQLAIRENMKILPIVIDGTGKNLAKNAIIFDYPAPMSLRVLEPVEVAEWTAKQAGELRDAVRMKMAAALASLRGPHTPIV